MLFRSVERALTAWLAQRDESTPIAKKDLRALPVFDRDVQARLFDEMDELFFDLYGFNKKQRTYLRILSQREGPEAEGKNAAVAE